MKALVIGGTGFIGSHLVDTLNTAGHKVWFTTRRTWDLAFPGEDLPDSDVVYICAAMSRFIECEDKPMAYRVNVDGPLEVARRTTGKIIYLSSEAVERALHTNYGMHKALAELALRTQCDPIIVRLSKVDGFLVDRMLRLSSELG